MMKEQNNATCGICGSPYHLCISCKDAMSANPWKRFTDTASHYQVFQVIRGYTNGVYAKDEAKDRLKNIDLSDLESFRPHIKEIVKDILKEDKTIEKPITSRKRDYKIDKVEVNEEVENNVVETE